MSAGSNDLRPTSLSHQRWWIFDSWHVTEFFAVWCAAVILVVPFIAVHFVNEAIGLWRIAGGVIPAVALITSSVAISSKRQQGVFLRLSMDSSQAQRWVMREALATLMAAILVSTIVSAMLLVVAPFRMVIVSVPHLFAHSALLTIVEAMAWGWVAGALFRNQLTATLIAGLLMLGEIAGIGFVVDVFFGPGVFASAVSEQDRVLLSPPLILWSRSASLLLLLPLALTLAVRSIVVAHPLKTAASANQANTATLNQRRREYAVSSLARLLSQLQELWLTYRVVVLLLLVTIVLVGVTLVGLTLAGGSADLQLWVFESFYSPWSTLTLVSSLIVVTLLGVVAGRPDSMQQARHAEAIGIGPDERGLLRVRISFALALIVAALSWGLLAVQGDLVGSYRGLVGPWFVFPLMLLVFSFSLLLSRLTMTGMLIGLMLIPLGPVVLVASFWLIGIGSTSVAIFAAAMGLITYMTALATFKLQRTKAWSLRGAGAVLLLPLLYGILFFAGGLNNRDLVATWQRAYDDAMAIANSRDAAPTTRAMLLDRRDWKTHFPEALGLVMEFGSEGMLDHGDRLSLSEFAAFRSKFIQAMNNRSEAVIVSESDLQVRQTPAPVWASVVGSIQAIARNLYREDLRSAQNAELCYQMLRLQKDLDARVSNTAYSLTVVALHNCLSELTLDEGELRSWLSRLNEVAPFDSVDDLAPRPSSLAQSHEGDGGLLSSVNSGLGRDYDATMPFGNVYRPWEVNEAILYPLLSEHSYSLLNDRWIHPVESRRDVQQHLASHRNWFQREEDVLLWILTQLYFDAQALANYRATVAALMLRYHLARTGEWPASLEQIETNPGESSPYVDPYTGRPFEIMIEKLPDGQSVARIWSPGSELLPARWANHSRGEGQVVLGPCSGRTVVLERRDPVEIYAMVSSFDSSREVSVFSRKQATSLGMTWLVGLDSIEGRPASPLDLPSPRD